MIKMIEIPYQALTLEEAIYLLEEQGGHFDARGFVMLEEGNRR